MSSDNTDQTSERPLVTFALFAYNQENYIREAVEGAFSQTYEPLEIILSDDCSTDRTFEIMQEMAAAYEGPHRVATRRSLFNLGTALHMYSAFVTSKGTLFVVSAGDDISLPERVEVLFNAWNRAGRPSGVVHSGWEIFHGHDVRSFRRFPAKCTAYSDHILEGYAHSIWLPAAAPTAAYTRDVFEKFAPLFGGSIIEDAPLFLRAALIGRFIPCDEVLVRSRLHDSNSGTGYKIDRPARWNRFMQSKIIAFRNMQSDLANWKGEVDPFLRVRIEQRILAVSHSASRLLLPEAARLGALMKIRLAFRMLFAPSVAPKFRLRVEYVLTFFGFGFHTRMKNTLRHWLKL